MECSVEYPSASDLAAIVNTAGYSQFPACVRWDHRVQIDARTGRTRPHKSVRIRKVAIVRRAYDLAFIANALRRPVTELASRAQNYCGTGAAGPEYGAGFGEVRVMRVTNHAARVVQPRGDRLRRAKGDIRINEFPSRRSQRHRGVRAAGPERGMSFTGVCIAAVTENVAGSIDAQGLAERKLIAEPGKVNGRCVAV